MKSVAILDYGAGNLGSVVRAVASLGYEPNIIKTVSELRNCKKVIFPGMGHAGSAMKTLRERGLDKALKDFIAAGHSFFGICVGMQVLGEFTNEDNTACLGILPFQLRKFDVALPVPHMGWNTLDWNPRNPNLEKAKSHLSDESHVYYVHSYAADFSAGSVPDFVAASSEYGGVHFAGFIAWENVWGTQFHTEKSGKTGLQCIRNFIEVT